MKKYSTTFKAACAGIFVAVFFFLLPAETTGDTIIFKSGRRVEGSIITQTRTTVIMRAGNRTTKYSKRRIRRIVYRNLTRAEVVALRKRARETRRRGARIREPDPKITRAEEKRIAAEKARLEKERLREEKLERDRQAKERREKERNAKELARKKKIARENAAQIAYERKRKAALAAFLAREKARQKSIEEDRKRAAARAREIQRRKDTSLNPSLDVLWRSAVLPGWGHQYFGNRGEGWTSSLLFGISAMYFVTARNLATSAQGDYNRDTLTNLFVAQAVASANSTDSTGLLFTGLALSTNLNRHDRARYELHIQNQRRASLLVALVYLAQLGHAWWSAPAAKTPKEVSSAATRELIFEYRTADTGTRSKKLTAGIRLRF